MVETLNFGEAAQRAGVSRERLNKAIRSGRLPATRGGGPGKPTTIRLEDLQAWCLSEGLAMPVDANEGLERSQPPAVAEMMGRLEQMFAGFERLERLVERVLERLERSQYPALAQGQGQLIAEPRAEASTLTREQVVARIRHARDVEKKSYQQIAHELNAAGVPTISGKGTWQKGNVERFYKGI
jgi:excisionase family DNA binding protein